jgi:hypothetical protein
MTSTPTIATGRGTAPARLTGGRRAADLAHTLLGAAFVLALLGQVYLAGTGAFARHTGAHAVRHAFAAHEHLGDALGITAVVLLVLALVAHADRITMIAAFVLALLTETAQHGLAQAGHDNRWVGGLHAFDGMVILLLACWLVLRGRRRARAAARGITPARHDS